MLVCILAMRKVKEMSKYKISDVIKDIDEQLDACVLCEGSFVGCSEYDQLWKRRDMLQKFDEWGYEFVDENDNRILDNGIIVPIPDRYRSIGDDNDDVSDSINDDGDDVDEEDVDLAVAALEDVLDIMDVSDKVLDILGDAEFETHVITADTYDSVNVSVTTDFGYSTAVGKTYPYNICDNNELLSSVVFDLVRDIVIELEGNYTYMRLMFENCVD